MLTNKPMVLYIENFRDVLRVNAFARGLASEFVMTLTDRNGSLADARSLLGLMSLTYTAPVIVYCNKPRYMEMLREDLAQNKTY